MTSGAGKVEDCLIVNGHMLEGFVSFTHILHTMHTKIFLDLYTMIRIFLRLVK